MQGLLFSFYKQRYCLKMVFLIQITLNILNISYFVYLVLINLFEFI